MSALDRLDAMVKAGVPYETALGLARGFEADVEAAVLRGAQAVAATIKVDAQADRRRERDRYRKRKEPIPQNSAESAEPLSEGSQGFPRPLPNPPNLSQEPPIVPQKASKSRRKGDFAKFWAEYPLKVGRGKAEPAYERALRRCESDDPEAEILDGLRRCKPLFEPEFIPHPTTWLNRDGWLDQLEAEHVEGGTGPPKFDLNAFEARRAEREREHAT